MEPISPLPPQRVRTPVMLQRWDSLTFLHWPFTPRTIERLLPPQIAIDTFEGKAWVGLTPFLLSNLRPPLLPPLPFISKFPETNVRTYVRGPAGGRGVWFFTLEAHRLLAVLGARVSYRLPYRWAMMSVRQKNSRVEYRSTRHHLFGQGQSRVIIEPGAKMNPGEFDHFLTARFRLYTSASNRIAYAQIEHEPWPLRKACLLELHQDLFRNSGVPQPSGEPILHFSEKLTVKIGRLRWLS